MKKHIKTVMFGLLIMFFVATIFSLIGDAFCSVFNPARLLIGLGVSGLFLGLYRIIDLLDKK